MFLAQSNANINQWSAQGTAQLNQMTQTFMTEAPKQAKMKIQQDVANQIEMRKEFEKRVEMEVSMVVSAQNKWATEFEKANGRQPTEAEIDQWYAINHPSYLDARFNLGQI